MTTGETHRAIEATFRIERARLITGLGRVVRNVDRAEELARDALVIALSEGPRTSVPANPGAWLMTAAKRRAVAALRRDKMLQPKREAIARLDAARRAYPFFAVSSQCRAIICAVRWSSSCGTAG